MIFAVVAVVAVVIVVIVVVVDDDDDKSDHKSQIVRLVVERKGCCLGLMVTETLQ